MARRWSLLFITDLHYESANSNYTDDPKELKETGYRTPIFPNFYNILKNGFPKPASGGGVPFDFIAIGGDITTHGKKDGFAKFESEAMPLLQGLVRNNESICLVPGNHDVIWGLRPTGKNSFRKKFEPFWDLVQRTRTTSCLFPDRELTKKQEDTLSFLSPANGPVYLDEKRKLLVVCINSSIRCGELYGEMEDKIANPAKKAAKILQHGLGELPKKLRIPKDLEAAQRSLSTINKRISKYLIRDVSHVTAAQMAELTNRLNKLKDQHRDEWESYFKVAVLHHPLIHFPSQIAEHKGYELMVDSADVLGWLTSYGFDLALTGHKHQPYDERHLSGGKEILLVGGPTVGGYSAGDSFRGLRWIEAEENEDHRVINIIDLPHGLGLGNAGDKIDEHLKQSKSSGIKIVRPAGAALQQRINQAGFYYRELASITVITEDGDARRTVEYEDLKINKQCNRTLGHEIHLPSTSGYLEQLRVQGRNFALHIKDPIPAGKQTWSTELVFDGEFPVKRTVSYFYEWYAVNSFAKDELQFDYKYGHPILLDNIEFTHFTTPDPVQELTVLVQFPPKYRPSEPPSLRVARVDDAVPDARNWKTDAEVEYELTAAHALRFYESMNVAAVRVKNPSPRLSYGIQWKVSGAPQIDQQERDRIRELREHFTAGQPSIGQRTALRLAVKEIIGAAHGVFMSKWKGKVDASLMYFDGSRELRILFALLIDFGLDDVDDTTELAYNASMPYGYGIAGRAFKSNGLRCYVSPEDLYAKEELNYYRPLPGSPIHKVMISWPLHIPESSDIFNRKNDIYQTKMPYGVLNLGSEEIDCPLKNLRLPESSPFAIQFQHDANWSIYQHLSYIFLDKNVSRS